MFIINVCLYYIFGLCCTTFSKTYQSLEENEFSKFNVLKKLSLSQISKFNFKRPIKTIGSVQI